MENEFIPYEQALELAKLNFNEKCFGYYGLENELYIEISCNLDSNLTRRNFIAAPTYSQAFRWFREKYNLGHMINGIGYESFIMNIAGVLHIFNAFEFKTYEEAELACLKKLIQTVENGK